jgi:hypothetical protein
VEKAGEKDPEYSRLRKALEEEERRASKEVAVLPREKERKDRKVLEKLSIEERLLYRKGMLWVLDDKDLIREVLESEHDTKIAGHMGQDKMIELV